MISILLWFLIGHVIADFYAQSENMALQKKTDRKALAGHIIIYSIVMLALGILTLNVGIILLAFALAIVHGLIDYVKFLYTKPRRLSKQQTITLFALDQLLHTVTIIGIIAIGFDRLTPDVWLLSVEYSNTLAVLLKWLLSVLIVIKPASIIVRMTLGYFEPKEVQDNNPGIIQAGEFIGILERITILILLGAGSYAAIGFVLTAKSIARYNKIADEPKFAEYYLIGTLMSALIVLIVFHIIFNV